HPSLRERFPGLERDALRRFLILVPGGERRLALRQLLLQPIGGLLTALEFPQLGLERSDLALRARTRGLPPAQLLLALLELFGPLLDALLRLVGRRLVGGLRRLGRCLDRRRLVFGFLLSLDVARRKLRVEPRGHRGCLFHVLRWLSRLDSRSLAEALAGQDGP